MKAQDDAEADRVKADAAVKAQEEVVKKMHKSSTDLIIGLSVPFAIAVLGGIFKYMRDKKKKAVAAKAEPTVAFAKDDCYSAFVDTEM